MRFYAKPRDGSGGRGRGDRHRGSEHRGNEGWSLPEPIQEFWDRFDPKHSNNPDPPKDDDPDDLNDPCTDDEDEGCPVPAPSSNTESEPTEIPNPALPTTDPIPTAPEQANDGSLQSSNTNIPSETSIPPAHSTITTPSPSTFTSSVSRSPLPTAPPEMVPPPIPEGPSDGKDFKLKTGHIAAAILIPLLFIILITIFVFLFLKRRRRRRQLHNDSRIHNLGTSRETRFSKMTAYSPLVHTMEQQPLPPPPTMSGAHLVPQTVPPQPAITNLPPIPYARPPSTQPIILGPMNQSNTGNYYTGLDADALSISESTTQRNGPYAVAEDPDEPPPPYRPRSVMNISREPSTRQQIHSIAESDESRRNLLPEYIPPPSRSPFEDPDPDDDAVSDISEPSQHHSFRRGHDVMSAVSDLSYQNSTRRP